MERIIDMLRSNDTEIVELGMALLCAQKISYDEKIRLIHQYRLNTIWFGETSYISNDNEDITRIK